jgi:hypothetical protein
MKKTFAEFKNKIQEENENRYNKISEETRKTLDSELEYLSSKVDENLNSLNRKIDEKINEVMLHLDITRGDLYSATSKNNYVAVNYYLNAAIFGAKDKRNISFTLQKLQSALQTTDDISESNHKKLLELSKLIVPLYPTESASLSIIADNIGIYKMEGEGADRNPITIRKAKISES